MLRIHHPRIQYPPPWRAVSHEESSALDRQLEKELSPRHVLHGAKFEAIARRNDNDDVLFSIAAETPRFAVVHLTYQAEPSPDGSFPYTVIYD